MAGHGSNPVPDGSRAKQASRIGAAAADRIPATATACHAPLSTLCRARYRAYSPNHVFHRRGVVPLCWAASGLDRHVVFRWQCCAARRERSRSRRYRRALAPCGARCALRSPTRPTTVVALRLLLCSCAVARHCIAASATVALRLAVRPLQVVTVTLIWLLPSRRGAAGGAGPRDSQVRPRHERVVRDARH